VTESNQDVARETYGRGWAGAYIQGFIESGRAGSRGVSLERDPGSVPKAAKLFGSE